MRNTYKSFISTLEEYKLHNPDPFQILTNESIAFQNDDDFGPRLEEVINKYKTMIDSGANKRAVNAAADLRAEIENIIYSRLNIRIKLGTSKYVACVFPNVYVPHNPMIREDLRVMYEKYSGISGQADIQKLKSGTVVGGVDTKTAKVSGWFTKQVCPVFINFYFLLGTMKLTVPEVTAIVLHELGHIFKAIVFCSNINTTNQILADVARNISTKGYGDVNYVYSKIKTIYPDAQMDLAESLCSKDRVVMNVALYRLVVGSTKSLMTESTYDKTGYEALSDQFSTRFGYGLYIVTGLEKFEKDFSEFQMNEEIYTSVKQVLIVSSLISIALYAMVIIPNPAIKVISVLFALFFNFIGKSAVDTQRATTKNMTYDNIRDRYKRIRNQIVEMIKDPSMDHDVKTAVLNEIAAIDMIISEKKVFVSGIETLANKYIPSDRRAFEDIRTQRELEDMIANDLFVSANRLAAAHI